MAVLTAENLSFDFGSEPLLNHINFAVNKSDFAAIIGSNGAGKSTLLRLILKELSPKAGTIKLFDEDIAGYNKWHRIGYVPQTNPVSNGQFPASVEEVVMSSLYSQVGAFKLPNKAHREKVLAVLESVGMREFAKRRISELSGGQLQRVMLARALVGDCELLILDEPTTGVDYDSCTQLYELLAQLNKNGLTVLMVTHDTERAFRYVSRMFCLEEGSIVELAREQLEHELTHRHKH